MTYVLNLGNLIPSHLLGMHNLPTIPTVGAVSRMHFKDATLREECVIETIWTEDVIKNPVKSSI